MSHELALSLILFFVVGAAAQWTAWRFRMPSIVVLIAFGVIAGPFLGILQPHETFGEGFPVLIELAVAIILFEGGMNLRYYEFKEAGRGVRRLISWGLILNWTIGALFAHYVGGFSWKISFFIASILVVTGPTVIMPALKQARLRRRPASYLKWEGIINDPLGALLAVVTFEYLIYSGEGSPIIESILGVGIAFGSSLLLAGGLALLIKFAYDRQQVPDFLKIPVLLSSVLGIFVLANYIQEGAGLLATTFLGIILGNLQIKMIQDIRRFKESLSVLILAFLFTALAASLDLDILQRLNQQSLLFILTILFVIRPLAVFISTFRSEMNFRERFIVAWFAPRGIVSASVAGTLGPSLMEFGYPDAELIVPLIFSVIFLSSIIYGFSFPSLSRLLKLTSQERSGLLLVGASPWNLEMASRLKEENIPILISDTASHRLRRARKQGFKTHEGAILLDIEQGRPDVTAYRYMLAATENDAYNSMVCTKLGEHMGRKNCFQLPIHTDDETQTLGNIPSELHGQVIRDSRLFYETILQNYYRSWRFVTTTVSQEMLDQDLIKELETSQTKVPVIIVHANRSLSLWKTDLMQKIAPGDRLILFVKDAKENTND